MTFIIKEVAQNANVKLIDLYSLTNSAHTADANFYSSDRFHPADQGYESWSNLIYGAIK